MKTKIKLLILVFLMNLISCTNYKFSLIDLDFNDVKKIKILIGYPGEEIQISNNLNKLIINDLKNLKEIQGPIKFGKTHKIVVFYNSKVNDTLFTNGTTYRYKNSYYSSKNDLLLKYKIK